MYCSTLSLTLALNGGGCLTPRSSHFTPGKETRYPLYRRLGWPQGWFGWVQKILLPTEFNPWTSSLQWVATPTELFRPTSLLCQNQTCLLNLNLH
jgi:hypothetical protein